MTGEGLRPAGSGGLALVVWLVSGGAGPSPGPWALGGQFLMAGVVLLAERCRVFVKLVKAGCLRRCPVAFTCAHHAQLALLTCGWHAQKNFLVAKVLYSRKYLVLPLGGGNFDLKMVSQVL